MSTTTPKWMNFLAFFIADPFMNLALQASGLRKANMSVTFQDGTGGNMMAGRTEDTRLERIPVPVLLTAAALAALMVGLSGCDPVIIHVSDYRPRFGSEVMDRSYAAGAAIKPQTLPPATGGTPPLVYTLSSVPGLTFDPDTRTLTGTPTQIGRYRLTYRVTDADGDMDFLFFKVTVAGTLKFASSVEDQEFETGVEIEPLHLPATTGGTLPLTYTLSNIPGLIFDPDTRTLTGTASPFLGDFTYDVAYAATDADGAAGVVYFKIRFVWKLTFGSSVNDQEYARGTEIEPRTLPVAIGGTPPLTYVLIIRTSGTRRVTELPGLSFDPHTRTLAGTPTRNGRYEATYVATDAAGATGVLRFEISVPLSRHDVY